MGSNGTFAKSGNIVLTHEIDNTTMQLAVDYVPKIKKAYKHVLDVATCANITYPYMEKTISFPSFEKAVSNSSSSTSKSSGSASATGVSPGASGASSSAVSDKQADTSAASSMAPSAVIAVAMAVAARLLL